MTPIPIPNGYTQTIVTPKASRSVVAYWTFTADSDGQSLILPDGRCDVILRSNIYDNDAAIPVVTGPATQAYVVTYLKGDHWTGIRLRPSYGVRLWKSAIGVAADTVRRGADAVALLPALEGLDRGVTPKAFSSVLEDKYTTDPKLIRALDALHASGGRIRIERLATYTGCTSRQLNRMFRANVGLSTKTYAQLVQFRRTLRLLQKRTPAH